MTYFNPDQLLRPSACFPRGHYQVFEAIAGDLRQNRFVLIRRKKFLPGTGRRLLDVLHWVLVEQAQPMCPTIWALHGSDGVVLISARPIGMSRCPAQHVVGFEV